MGCAGALHLCVRARARVCVCVVCVCARARARACVGVCEVPKRVIYSRPNHPPKYTQTSPETIAQFHNYTDPAFFTGKAHLLSAGFPPADEARAKWLFVRSLSWQHTWASWSPSGLRYPPHKGANILAAVYALVRIREFGGCQASKKRGSCLQAATYRAPGSVRVGTSARVYCNSSMYTAKPTPAKHALDATALLAGGAPPFEFPEPSSSLPFARPLPPLPCVQPRPLKTIGEILCRAARRGARDQQPDAQRRSQVLPGCKGGRQQRVSRR